MGVRLTSVIDSCIGGYRAWGCPAAENTPRRVAQRRGPRACRMTHAFAYNIVGTHLLYTMQVSDTRNQSVCLLTVSVKPMQSLAGS